MRNLKRVLSLSLASIMLLGMMVIGTSAAQDYTDVDYVNDNIEAIEVLDAINVMRGDLDANGELAGTFRPGSDVKRSEMARIMAFLMDLDYDYYVGVNPFTDMAGHWAEGFAAACAANGIIYGRTSTTYDPDATVTAVEAAAMLMRALGYFQNPAVDQPNGFEIDTVRQAGRINLFNKVDVKTNEPMTRNDVAQLVLNALQSGMVEPSENSKVEVTVGDAQVTIGSSNYVYVVSRDRNVGNAINTDRADQGNGADGLTGPVLDLGEHLYQGELKRSGETNTLDQIVTDPFGRPARKWEYKGKEIGTYVKDELQVGEDYTGTVTGRDLYELLGASALRDYDLDIYIDGVHTSDPGADELLNNPWGNAWFDESFLVRGNDTRVGQTNRGVLTQVYVDPYDGNGRITIAIINTYLAIAEDDFDTRTDSLDVTVYGVTNVGDPTNPVYVKNASFINNDSDDQSELLRLELEDFPGIADAKEDDACLVQIAQGEVQVIMAPEILAGVEVTSFRRDNGGFVVVDGQQYNFASAIEFDADTLNAYSGVTGVINLKEITYNIYLDQYGNAIGVEEVDHVDNYVFITGVDTNASNRYAVQADATAIFLDGTMGEIKIDMSDLDSDTEDALLSGIAGGSLVNAWFTYSVGSNDVYYLELVSDDADDAFAGNARVAQFRTGTEDDDGFVGSTVDGLDDEDGVNEIHKNSIALRGAVDGPYYSVYGNDASVYIVAELERIAVPYAEDGDPETVNVINDIDTIIIGVDNADIEVWSEDDAYTEAGAADATAYGTYTLFHKNGYVIGAVVVGEDNGAMADWVFVHSGSASIVETNNGSNTTKAAVKGTYTWTRDVYSLDTMEVVTLTEVGSGISMLNGMDQWETYVIRYDANGNVRTVSGAWEGGKGLAKYNEPWNDRFVTSNESLQQAMKENNGTVLFDVTAKAGTSNANYYAAKVRTELNDNYNGADKAALLASYNSAKTVLTSEPTLNDKRTLYVQTGNTDNDTQGFLIDSNVKVILRQTNNNDTTTRTESGVSGLQRVINALHDTDQTGTLGDGYHYELTVLMSNYRAVAVIFRDLNGAGAITNSGNNNLTELPDGMEITNGNTGTTDEPLTARGSYDRENERLYLKFYRAANTVAVGGAVTPAPDTVDGIDLDDKLTGTMDLTVKITITGGLGSTSTMTKTFRNVTFENGVSNVVTVDGVNYYFLGYNAVTAINAEVTSVSNVAAKAGSSNTVTDVDTPVTVGKNGSLTVEGDINASITTQAGSTVVLGEEGGDSEITLDDDAKITGSGTTKVVGKVTGGANIETKIELADGAEIDEVKSGVSVTVSGEDAKITGSAAGAKITVEDDAELTLDTEYDGALPTITGTGSVVISAEEIDDDDYASKLGQSVKASKTPEADDTEPDPVQLPKGPKLSGDANLLGYTEGDNTTLDDIITANKNGDTEAEFVSLYTITLTAAQAPVTTTANEAKMTVSKSYDGEGYDAMNAGGKNEPTSATWNETEIKAEYRNIVLFVADTVHSIKIVISYKDGEETLTYTYIFENPAYTGAGASAD